jgi:hypothetical protein
MPLKGGRPMNGAVARGLYTPPPGFEIHERFMRASFARRYFFLNPDRVWKVHAVEKVVEYYMDDGSTVIGDRPLVQVLRDFPNQWVRLSRDTAVRFASIIRVDRGSALMENGERVTISRRQFRQLFDRSVPVYRAARNAKLPEPDAAEAYWRQH